jgi:hypothetical protein
VRSPSAEEMAQASALISASPSPVEDLIWALLNSPEFLFNQ